MRGFYGNDFFDILWCHVTEGVDRYKGEGSWYDYDLDDNLRWACDELIKEL